MRLRFFGRLPLVAIGGIFAVASATAADPTPGFADPLLGRWNLTVQGEDSDYPSWLEITLRTETELMGRFVGRFGSVRYASAVRFGNNQLQVRVPAQYERGVDELVFTGRLDGELLVGEVAAGGDSIRWTGVRAPRLERTDVERWGQPVDLLAEGLSGWRQRFARHPGCWTVADGVLRAKPPCTDLVSEALFDDFRLRLEFRYPSGSNSGVYLRGRYEVQIQDGQGKAIDPLRIGGLYGFIAPSTNAAAGPDEWQSMDIVLVGRRLSVSLNGIEIISRREIPGITGGALDSEEGSAGPIMLQGDHGPIEFRNIVVNRGD